MLVNINISTASVNMSISFTNTAGKELDCLFLLPTRGTVTQCLVQVGSDRYMETSVVASDEAQSAPQKDLSKSTLPTNDVASSIPDLFRLPITNIPKGATVTILLDFLETLAFSKQHFVFQLPLTVPAELLPKGRSFSEVVKIAGSIYNPMPMSQLSILSGTYMLMLQPYPCSTAFTAQSAQSADFHIQYQLPTPQITGTLIKEASTMVMDPASGMIMQEAGSFALFVTPPTAQVGFRTQMIHHTHPLFQGRLKLLPAIVRVLGRSLRIDAW